MKLQAGKLQSHASQPARAVRKAVQRAGLQVLLLEWIEAKVLPLEALPPSQETPVLEHVGGVGIESPVIALSGVSRLSGHLHEAVIKREVVADRVLPCWEFFPVINEALADEVADLTESETLLWALKNRHGYQSDVRVWGFYGRGSFALCGRIARRADGGPRAALLLSPRLIQGQELLLPAVFDSFSNHVDNSILHDVILQI